MSGCGSRGGSDSGGHGGSIGICGGSRSISGACGGRSGGPGV